MLIFCAVSGLLLFGYACKIVSTAAYIPQVVEVGKPAQVTCTHAQAKSRDDGHVTMWKHEEEIRVTDTMVIQITELRQLPVDLRCAFVAKETAVEYQHNLTSVWEDADDHPVPLIGVNLLVSTEEFWTNLTAELAVSDDVRASDIELEWSHDNVSLDETDCDYPDEQNLICETVSLVDETFADYLTIAVVFIPDNASMQLLWIKDIPVFPENKTDSAARNDTATDPQIAKLVILSCLLVVCAGLALFIVACQCRALLWDVDPTRDDSELDGMEVSIEQGKLSFRSRPPPLPPGMAQAAPVKK